MVVKILQPLKFLLLTAWKDISLCHHMHNYIFTYTFYWLSRRFQSWNTYAPDCSL